MNTTTASANIPITDQVINTMRRYGACNTAMLRHALGAGTEKDEIQILNAIAGLLVDRRIAHRGDGVFTLVALGADPPRGPVDTAHLHHPKLWERLLKAVRVPYNALMAVAGLTMAISLFCVTLAR